MCIGPGPQLFPKHSGLRSWIDGAQLARYCVPSLARKEGKKGVRKGRETDRKEKHALLVNVNFVS